MAIIVLPTFDPCERPNCPEDITLEFVVVPTSVCHLETAQVAWRISGTDSSPTSTDIYYSLNNNSLDDRTNSSVDVGIYSPGDLLYSLIPFQGSTGVLYIQARAVIDGVLYRTKDPIRTIIINECEASCFPAWKIDPATPGNKVSDVYIEFGTYGVPDQIQVYGNYDPSDPCEEPTNILYDTGCTGTWTTSSKYPPTIFNPNAQLYPEHSD